MVDFKKRLAGKAASSPVDPLELYDSLDRAHDKGPLRPAQKAVLKRWNETRSTRDVIIKLHTGQGKTLVGLLILQSQLNAQKGPALYLCPTNHLIEQTCTQAKQFGIATCQAEDELPDEFLNGEKILVTSVHKLFNGLTKFKLNNHSLSVGTILMDDAHACSDIIRHACRIRLSKTEQAYSEIKSIFESNLEKQGVGTYADLCNGKRDAILPVPYWTWMDHEADIARILSKYSESRSIKYAWPLLKDILKDCQCVFSGNGIEIEPFVPPLHVFGSYYNAQCRIFMSATVTDDAFLVKGLQLSPETIMNPLIYEKETWSGEKMILIPSMINPSLTREMIVEKFGKPNEKRRFGVVVLSPGFEWTKDWKAYGSIVAETETISSIVNLLQSEKFKDTIVLANRYDGIDLPDNSCRILIFDGKPYSESLVDLYEENCRPHSSMTLMRTLRTIEQGMGRSVRGEKDYSVIIVLGQELTRLLRDKNSKKYLSAQMAMQIDLGLEISEFARQDIEEGEEPDKSFMNLITQSIGRDDGWKEFYKERMDKIIPNSTNEELLKCYKEELDAELKNSRGDHVNAVITIQGLLDGNVIAKEDKFWYLQMMARYNYKPNRPESSRLQNIAYNGNRFLLRPEGSIAVKQLQLVSHGRIERIGSWIRKYDSYIDMEVAISDILECLKFGVKADKFENALDELSTALGFIGERPDKEWKEGPDNLWALNDRQYILWECKNEVKVDRIEINKDETDQMNKSSAWFERHYKGLSVKRILIHPARALSSGSALSHQVSVMRVNNLKKLTDNIRAFFRSFSSTDIRDLSPTQIQSLVDSHKLSLNDLIEGYSQSIKDR